MPANFTITPSAGGSAAAMADGYLVINIGQVDTSDPDQVITLSIENTGDETITITSFDRQIEPPWNTGISNGSLPKTIAPAASNTDLAAELDRYNGPGVHIQGPQRGLLIINYTLSGSPGTARSFAVVCFAVVTDGSGDTPPTFDADALSAHVGSYHSNQLAPATLARPAGTDTFTWTPFDDPTSNITKNTEDGYQCMLHLPFAIMRDLPLDGSRLIGFPIGGMEDLTGGNHVNYTAYANFVQRWLSSGFIKSEVQSLVDADIAKLRAFADELPGEQILIYEGSFRQLPDVLMWERVNNDDPWKCWREMKRRLDLWADLPFADLAFDVPYGVSSWNPPEGSPLFGLANPIDGITPADSYRYWGYKWACDIKLGDGLYVYAEPLSTPTQVGWQFADGYGACCVAQSFRDIFELQGIGNTFADFGRIVVIDMQFWPDAVDRLMKIYAAARAFLYSLAFSVEIKWMPYLWLNDQLDDTSNVLSEVQTIVDASYSSKGSFTP